MKRYNYVILNVFFLLDAFLYGVVLSYTENTNDIWALFRYIILFISMYDIEKLCEKIEINTKEKFRISIVVVCIITEFLLGYFLSSIHFLSYVFICVLIMMVLIGVLELRILTILLKNNESSDKKEIKELKFKEIYSILTIDQNADKVRCVKCLFYLGLAMILLCITLFVIPMLIRNTYIELLPLFCFGMICYIMFCVINYKKYILFNLKKNLLFYYVEVLGILLCIVFMYYVYYHL